MSKPVTDRCRNHNVESMSNAVTLEFGRWGLVSILFELRT